ncbi:glycosyltransferase [Oculatella sp. FACHB-28]|uniref:glycosyltransferase n=1 Tax=Oculatella sp. FACHB-28 TaxID=2692845 RepID=UPI001F54D8F2|nr:glycosyltransferase [Oculatella sp. FACHB-28]
MTPVQSDEPMNQPVDEKFLPPVSVIIPIYNGEADLPDLLDCLWAQTYPASQVEYLLVDNGSGDRTPDLLKAAVQTSGDRGITLRYLSETQVQSSYAARNTGVRAAKSEILAFTDADCRPQPDWLINLIQPFTDPAVGLVAGEVVALPGTTLLEEFADRQDTLSQKHTLAHPFLPYGQTANLAIRQQALEKAGLFRPYLTTGGDADMCWRIQQQGNWKLAFAESAVVQHRHRATLSELRRQWHRYGRSNRYLHELHGVSLMREPTSRDYFYRWSRWFLKEMPIAAVKIANRKANLVDLINTPVGLMCWQARSQGQREARLSDAARQIEWLHQSQFEPPIEAPD